MSRERNKQTLRLLGGQKYCDRAHDIASTTRLKREVQHDRGEGKGFNGQRGKVGQRLDA